MFSVARDGENCGWLVWCDRSFFFFFEPTTTPSFPTTRAVRAAEPCLSAGSKVLLISSQMSSIARTAAGPPEGAMLGYKMSKAAANVAAASLAARLRPRGVGVGVIHPGAIATDMYAYYHSHGGDDRAAAALTALAHRGGPTPPADAARAVVDAALAVSAEGEFVFRTVEGGDGVLPW